MSTTAMSFAILIVAISIIQPLSGERIFQPTYVEGTVAHIEVEPVVLTLNLNYAPTCPGIPATNLTVGLVELPLDSLMINVLEYASKAFSLNLLQFELLYINQVGYFVLSINGLASSQDCIWTITTDPPISDHPLDIGPSPNSESINDIFVSNYGMVVNLTFEARDPNDDFVSPEVWLKGRMKKNQKKSLKPLKSLDIKDPISVTYSLSFPHTTECPKPPGITELISVNVTSGQTALNVIEKAADMDVTLAFTLHNWFGLFYSIRGINVAYTSSVCQWCVKFSTDETTNPYYLLSVAPNDFTIPMFGGFLRLEYTQVGLCNFAQNNLNKGLISKPIWSGSKQYRSAIQMGHMKSAQSIAQQRNRVLNEQQLVNDDNDSDDAKPTSPAAANIQIKNGDFSLFYFAFIVILAVFASITTTILLINCVKAEHLKLYKRN